MIDLIKHVETKYLKKKAPELRAGDVIKVYQKIKEGTKERIQIFEGIVMKTHGSAGLDGTFTVRRISFEVGIERTFSLHSPTIIKVEKIKSIKVRRARLYYLRNLLGKKAKKSKELKDFVVWEEQEAIKEEEVLKAKLEAEAQAKKEAEEKAQAELDKKFTAIRGEEVKGEVVKPEEKPEKKAEDK